MESVKQTPEAKQEKLYKRSYDDKNYGPTGSQLEWLRRNNKQYIDFNYRGVGPRDFEY